MGGGGGGNGRLAPFLKEILYYDAPLGVHFFEIRLVWLVKITSCRNVLFFFNMNGLDYTLQLCGHS